MNAIISATLVLIGLATYYEAPGTAFTELRTGESTSSVNLKRVVAVDVSMWHILKGATLVVCSEFACSTFDVRDSGYLFRAGRFTPTKVGERYRYAPVPQRGQRIVLDFPTEAFRLLSPDLDTIQVRAWRLSIMRGTTVGLLTKPGCKACQEIEYFISEKLGLPVTHLDVTKPVWAWLNVRMLQEEIRGVPALLLNNKITEVGNSKQKALAALREAGLLPELKEVRNKFISQEEER